MRKAIKHKKEEKASIARSSCAGEEEEKRLLHSASYEYVVHMYVRTTVERVSDICFLSFARPHVPKHKIGL